MSPLFKRSISRGPYLVAGLFVLLLGLLALAQEGLRHLRESHQATGPAEWIWAPTASPRDVLPLSFYAVRDFKIETPPDMAHLQVLGDEEYRVYLNGRFLGGNVYHRGARPDVYSVGPWLQRGINRLVVQGRSIRGGGGLLVHLEGQNNEGQNSPDHVRTIIASDSSWEVQYKLSLGQLRGWEPLDPLDAVHSWGRPPVGRWGTMKGGEERPLFDPLATLGADIRPLRLQQDPDQPAVFLLDWGRPITGYLTLELTPGSGRFARLFLGDDESTLLNGDFYNGAVPIPIIGGLQESRWQDSIPRRFRYARIVGLEGVLGALVTPADPSLVDRLVPPPREGGLLGIDAPLSPSPLDAAVGHALRASKKKS